jgi:hypothetical protein
MYVPTNSDDAVAILESALTAVIDVEPLEKKIRALEPEAGAMPGGDIARALGAGAITAAEATRVERARALRRKAIMVDDFPKDLGRTEIYQTTEAVSFEGLRGASAA